VAVIGGGGAGLAAAGHAAAGGASTVCFEPSPLHGGLVANVGKLDDFPSMMPMAGAAVADLLLARAREHGAEFCVARVQAVLPAEQGLLLSTDQGDYAAKACVIASGARLRTLGVPGEAELAGRGVSQCDWCDGGLYRGKRVAVVGGGNAAVQAALHLAELCESVTLVVRGANLSARRDYVLRAADQPKIEFLWETVVEAIAGSTGVDGLKLRNTADGSETSHEIAGVFVFAGVIPNTGFEMQGVAKDAEGFILAGGDYRTSAPNVFAAGAVRRGQGGTLVGAMGEGASAAAGALAMLRGTLQ
jgi:thioredoxin reductase (NADPH)